MKITLVLNRDAGTLRGLDAKATGDELAEIFRGHGHEVDVQVAAGKDAVAAIRKACQAKQTDAVVVGGGDGTVSAAAAAAAECGVALGVLPLGTMNFFAKSLEIPLDMRAAAEALAAGEIAEVDIAKVNGRTFIHTLALGLHPALVAEREKLTYHSRIGKMLGSLRAWVRVIRNPRRFSVTIVTDNARVDRRTAGLVVSNNPLGEGHMPYADNLNDGLLAVYLTTARGWRDLVRVTASAALGSLVQSPLVEVHETGSAEITVGKRLVPMTLDGELVRISGPLRVECVRNGLKVLKPKALAK